MLIETNALVLKSFPYSDTSLLTRLYTEQQGKVTILAKGARRAKNNVVALLEPLNTIDVSYYYKDGRGIQILKEVSASVLISGIRENYEKLVLALAVLDIFDHTSHEHDPNPILFRLATRTIKEMENTVGSGVRLFWFFVLQLMIRTGFKPNFFHCGKCNKILETGILDRLSGAICCDRCLKSGDVKLGSVQLNYLRSMNECHIEDVDNLTIADEFSSGIFDFLLSFASFHLEGMGKVKSLKLIHKNQT